MASNRPTSFLTDFSTDKRSFGFYLIGSLIVILFSFFGQIPMFFFLPHNSAPVSNQMDYFAHLDSNLTLLLLLIPSLIGFLGFYLSFVISIIKVF